MNGQIDGLPYVLSPTDVANSTAQHAMLFAYKSPLNYRLLSSKLEELADFIPEVNGKLSNLDGSYPIEKRDLKPVIKFVKRDEEMPKYGPSHPLENVSNLLAPEISHQLVDNGAPICGFQITHFKCGGSVLGMSASHAIFDGPGRGWVLVQWARMCRNEKDMLPIDLNRSKVEMLATNSMVEATHKPILKVSKSQLINSMGNLYATPCSYKIFNVKITAIENLKNEIALTSTANDHWVSKQDVLVAKIWQSVAKAYGDSAFLKLITMEDFRRNPKTKLPKYYVGNAIIHGEIKFNTTEIATAPLAVIARRLRQNSKDTLAIKNICDQVAMQKLHCRINSEEFTAWGDTSTTVDSIITVSNLSKFPLRELDFGSGLPFWVGGLERLPFRNITIFPLAAGDEYAVHISLPTTVMTNLIDIISSDPFWEDDQSTSKTVSLES